MRKILIIFSVLITFTLSNCQNNTKKGAGNSVLQPAQNGTAEIAFNEYAEVVITIN